MSSFKKAIPKRKYRERSQPDRRKHLGSLEKKKDYKLRADDTHKKEKELERLREIAYFKNPEEFHYGMENTQIIAGKHRRLEPDVPLKLKKKQKILEGNLLNMKVQNKVSKHLRLQSELHLIDAPIPNTHIIFVDSPEKAEKLDLAEYFDTVPELVGNKSNRLTKKQLQDHVFTHIQEPEGYKNLETVIKEENLLKKSLDKNIQQKKLLGPEKFKVIDEDTKVIKWFRERKK
jgi:U3 small nucleolar RNA-associated protein 11